MKWARQSQQPSDADSIADVPPSFLLGYRHHRFASWRAGRYQADRRIRTSFSDWSHVQRSRHALGRWQAYRVVDLVCPDDGSIVIFVLFVVSCASHMSQYVDHVLL